MIIPIIEMMWTATDAPVAVLDSISNSDAFECVVVHNVALLESCSEIDLFSNYLNLSSLFSDLNDCSEIIAYNSEIFSSITENQSSLDSLARAVNVATVLLDNAYGYSTASIIDSVFSASFNDSQSSTAIIEAVSSLLLQLSETTGVNEDVVSSNALLQTWLSELQDSQDNLSSVSLRLAHSIDSLTSTDLIDNSLVVSCSLEELDSSLEAYSGTLINLGLVQESVGSNDSIQNLVNYFTSLSDSLSVVDAYSNIATLSLVLVESTTSSSFYSCRQDSSLNCNEIASSSDSQECRQFYVINYIDTVDSFDNLTCMQYSNVGLSDLLNSATDLSCIQLAIAHSLEIISSLDQLGCNQGSYLICEESTAIVDDLVFRLTTTESILEAASLLEEIDGIGLRIEYLNDTVIANSFINHLIVIVSITFIADYIATEFIDSERPLLFTDAEQPVLFADIERPTLFIDAEVPILFIDSSSRRDSNA